MPHHFNASTDPIPVGIQPAAILPRGPTPQGPIAAHCASPHGRIYAEAISARSAIWATLRHHAPVDALLDPQIDAWPLLHQGKVRNVYDVGDGRLLMVATDRLSAFDVVLPDPITGKGVVLTQLSRFWFARTTELVANHLLPIDPHEYLSGHANAQAVADRSMVVKRLEPLPVEAVVRGYLIGSGWKDYQATGEVCGVSLPSGLRQADRLPEIIYTPSTKAAVGDHDENIDYAATERILGAKTAAELRRISIALYRYAAEHAKARGLILADTKFEFGRGTEGRIVLMDEALTPDSSRYWPADSYQPGISPPSFDKQVIRDYLEALDWDKTPPGPRLPAEVIERAAARYREAYDLLTDGAPMTAP